MATWLSQQSAQTHAFKQLLTIADAHAFLLIDPPMFIDYDDFRADQPDHDATTWIKLTNPLGRLLVLRPDLTTSVMDKLQWKKSDGPLKVSYYASTFERNKTRLAAKKEFGFEFFNAPIGAGERDIRNTLKSLQTSFGVEMIVECSHREMLDTLMDLMDVQPADSAQIKAWFNHKSFDALNGWMKTQDLSSSVQSLMTLLLTQELDFDAFKQAVESFGFLDRFDPIFEALQPFTSIDGIKVVIDFTLMGDWTYYSGLIFQAVTPSLPHPLIKGGRYLVAGLGGEAIGFSIAMDDLLEVTR